MKRASELLGRSYRQVKRIWARYREGVGGFAAQRLRAALKSGEGGEISTAAVDFHWEAPEDLDQVFCLEEERVLARDWVVRYHNRWLQVRAWQEAWVKRG